MSADVGDALLGFRLGSSLGPRGKREDSCVLPFIEPRQQHDVAIGELERVMIDVKRALVDLAKDRNGVAGICSKHEGGMTLDWLLERQFGTRKYADSHRAILRRGESSGAGAKVVCDEFFAHFCWACSHSVQTVVAHIRNSSLGGPRECAILSEKTPRRINREQVANATHPRIVIDGARAQAAAADTYRQLSLFGDVFERLRADYVEKPDDSKLIESAINGMLAGLDPHSSYMDSKSFRDMQVETRGEFGGAPRSVTEGPGAGSEHDWPARPMDRPNKSF
jgi:hypothetical protein